MQAIRVDDKSDGWGETVEIGSRYTGLIGRLEDAARRRPDQYRRRVIFAGTIGYFVIGAMILVLASVLTAAVYLTVSGTGGAVLWIKIGAVAALTGYAMLSGLLIAPAPPEGRLLTQRDTPTLFALIDEIRAVTRDVKVDEVRLTDEMNAAITQEPRIGPFGNVSRLYLGLPLLRALTLDEVRAVIAHEFGHFVSRHGRSTSFVFRVRSRWANIARALPPGLVSGLLRRFFAWYAPWFAAYSLTLARRQEFEADAFAASLTGAPALAGALKRLEMQSAHLQEQWEMIWQSAKSGATLPEAPSEIVANAFRSANVLDLNEPTGHRALAAALRRTPELTETHPTLRQRLTALNQDEAPPVPLANSAAEDLFAEGLTERLAAAFDSEWKENCREWWGLQQEIHEMQLAERKKLLDREGSLLSSEELMELAELEESIDGFEGAIRGFERILRHDPSNGVAAFRLGAAMAALDQAEAVEHLLSAAKAEPTIAADALLIASSLLDRCGDPAGADNIRASISGAERRGAAAASESNSINRSVELYPVEEPKRGQIAVRLGEISGISRAKVAFRRRKLSVRPQILVLFKPAKGAAASSVCDEICAKLVAAGDVFVIEDGIARYWLAWKMNRIPGARLIG